MTGPDPAPEASGTALHEALLSAFPHPIVCIRPDARVAFANPAAELFFDTSAAMLQRHRLARFLVPDSPLLQLVEQAQARGIPASVHGISIILPRLGERVVDATVTPVTDIPDAVLVVLQERSIAMKIDRHMTQKSLGNSVASMAAILAHEIKNPLAGIKGAAQLIEQHASEADRSLTKLICDETERIRNLVDRTEIFTDQRQLTAHPVNIHEVLDHVKRLGVSSFAKSIHFVEGYDPSLPPVAGDRDRLVQVFLNLVKNAADALVGQADGEIVLQTSFRAGVHLSVGEQRARMSLPLEISVRDNGPGIPDAVRQSLFEPFVTSKPKGQGLGLAIVSKIVGDHGGTIECESEPRRTIFRCRLPMYKSVQEKRP
ncbi:MAG: two-component system sensor histidine kinase NtrB [Alphaproteobacteria bacterium]|jgi:two-component system nitrogen regulation sensor histidine kinase GlnL